MSVSHVASAENRGFHAVLFASSSRLQRIIFYIVLMILVLTLCSWIGASQNPIAFPFDDAYIAIHNARGILSAGDENYAGVSPLMGSTSLVHTTLLAFFMLGLPPLLATFVVATLSVLLYGLGLAKLTFDQGGSVTLTILVLVLGMATGYVPYHLLNGLETTLAMAAIAWSCALALKPQPTRLLAIVCGVMPFIRPELLVLSVAFLAHQTVRRLRNNPSFFSTTMDIGLAALAAAPLLLWQWTALDSLYPLTAQAKEYFFATSLSPALVKIDVIVGGLWRAGLFPLLIVIPLLRRGMFAACLGVSLVVILAAYYIKFPNGLWHNYFRYAQLFVPILTCGLVVALRTNFYPALFVLAVSLGSIPWYYSTWPYYSGSIQWSRSELEDVAAWTRSNLPADASILVHDAGYMAFATPFPLVDLVGLKTPESVALHKSLTAPSNGRLRGDAIHLIAEGSKAHYAIILNDQVHFWGQIADDLRAHGWQLEPLRQPPTEFGYVVYRLTAPNG